MNNIKKILIILSILLFSNCNIFSRLILGVEKHPKEKTSAQLAAYIFKNKFPLTNQYYVEPNGLKELFKLSSSANAYFVFDSLGQLVGDSKTRNCSGLSMKIFDSVLNRNYKNIYIDNTIQLNNLKKELILITHADSAKFLPSATVLFTWATYMGKLNHLYYQKKYSQIKTKIKGKNIELISVSLDFIEKLDYSNFTKDK